MPNENEDPKPRQQSEEEIKLRAEMLKDPELFRKALRSGDDYLGDRDVVESLLRISIARYSDILLSDDNEVVKHAAILHRARETAQILLGNRTEYDVVDGWNKPGVIDRFCQKWLGLDPGLSDPVDVMTHAIIKLFVEIREVADFADDGEALEEQWQPAADSILNRYIGIFMGVDLPTQAILS